MGFTFPVFMLRGICFVVILFSLSSIAQTLYRAYTSPLRKIPGPWYARISHIGLKWHVLRGRRIHYIHELHARYGPIVQIAPNEVAVSDLDAFGEIHRIGSGYLKSPWYQQFSPSESPGIFVMIDPKAHAVRRKLFAQAFSKSYLRQNWETVIRSKAEIAVAKIKRDAQNGGVDILKWWTFLATDVIGHLSFGGSFRMLEQEEKTPYIRDLETAMFQGGIRAEMPWLHAIGKNIPLPPIKELLCADDRLFQYGTLAIDNSKANDSGKSTIFSKMMAEGEDGSLTEFDIKQEASNLIVAGSDTTAVTLTYLVWSVLKHPGLQKQLQEEVEGIPDGFSDSDLEKLPFLNAVIDETLRLYGAAPGSLPRIVPQGGRTLSGYFIPADTTVSTQAYSMHRDSKIFPNSEIFDPQRWLKDISSEAKVAFSPFGAGSRTCIGVHLARMELRLASALFFRQCSNARLAPGQTDEMMEMENYFLISPVSHKCDIIL